MATGYDVETVIVGTGFSGIGMAIRLLQAGRSSFVVLEKAGEVGGTWRENHYPGCACDVPSHLYSYSFEPNPAWSRMFAPQGEILAYIRRCAEKYGVMPHIRFGSELTGAVFDEAAGVWAVQTRQGVSWRCKYLVLGLGALHRPAFPQIPDLGAFRGAAFHSAEWNHGVDLSGKRVAVIGTGASAIQFVPQVQKQAAALTLFQRTAPWVMPKPDGGIPPAAQALFRAAPLSEKAFRYFIYWWMEGRGLGFTLHPAVMKLAAKMGHDHIARAVADPALRKKLTPAYTPGCKRILMANDYYPALAQPNVEVVTEPIARATATGLVTADGRARDFDALIYGTGFRVTDLLTPLTLRGRRGVDLNDAWRGGVEAYRGTHVSGFPNVFLLMGPNTGLGHNSMVFMIESQVNYVLRYMKLLDAQGKPWADVRPGAQRGYNARLQPRLERAVWASGCQSWYLDENGKNTTAWPGFTFEYWFQMLRVRARDFTFAA
jgi:cation diffusion facilitator CzcD-associated flavoprotein CzcO